MPVRFPNGARNCASRAGIAKVLVDFGNCTTNQKLRSWGGGGWVVWLVGGGNGNDDGGWRRQRWRWWWCACVLGRSWKQQLVQITCPVDGQICHSTRSKVPLAGLHSHQNESTEQSLTRSTHPHGLRATDVSVAHHCRGVACLLHLRRQ